jgi:hypothetical protein
MTEPEKVAFAIRRRALRKPQRATQLRRKTNKMDNTTTLDFQKKNLSARRRGIESHAALPTGTAGVLPLALQKEMLSAKRRGIESNASLPTGAAGALQHKHGSRWDLPLYTVSGLAAGRKDAILQCKLSAPEESMSILWGGTTVTITTTPASIDTDQLALMGWDSIGEFDPRALMGALQLGLILTKKDKTRPHFSVLQIADGRLRSGCQAGVIIVRDRGLGSLSARIPVSDARVLLSVIAELGESAKFFEAPHHWLFCDDLISCFVDKPQHSFPNVDALLAKPLSNQMLVAKADLLSRLSRLMIVASRPASEILELSWGASRQIHLKVQTVYGTEKSDLAIIPLTPEIELSERCFHLRLDLTKRLVKALPTGEMLELGLVGQHTLAIRCGDDSIGATALLSSGSY